MLQDFKRIGHMLATMDLISSHGGNLSVRMGDRIVITRRGSMLADLREGDLVDTALDHEDSKVIMASTEIVVHRAIYQETSALAIVHCHPPHSIALSLVSDAIVPIDSEGSYLLHRVPVVATGKTIGSHEVAQLLPPVLKEYKVVMLRGHGSFATGQLLEEGLMLSSSLEVSSRIITISNALDKHIHEYRENSSQYDTW